METVNLKQLDEGTSLLVEGIDGDLFELTLMLPMACLCAVSANDTRIPEGTLSYARGFHGLESKTPLHSLTPDCQLQLNFENGFLRSSKIKSITINSNDWSFTLGDESA